MNNLYFFYTFILHALILEHQSFKYLTKRSLTFLPTEDTKTILPHPGWISYTINADLQHIWQNPLQEGKRSNIVTLQGPKFGKNLRFGSCKLACEILTRFSWTQMHLHVDFSISTCRFWRTQSLMHSEVKGQFCSLFLPMGLLGYYLRSTIHLLLFISVTHCTICYHKLCISSKFILVCLWMEL